MYVFTKLDFSLSPLDLLTAFMLTVNLKRDLSTCILSLPVGLTSVIVTSKEIIVSRLRVCLELYILEEEPG